jgi:DNA-binding XRE family transcriptional regulator
MVCEKNTEQMTTDVFRDQEESMNTTISERSGTDMTNETTLTGEILSPIVDKETEVIADAVHAEPVPPIVSDREKKNRRKENEPDRMQNSLREFRIEQMMSKAELARKAGLSVLTIDRIEKGFGCRMDTKRKILKALGLKLSDRRKLFQEE